MDKKQSSRILHCHCAYANTLPSKVTQEVLRTLKESGLTYSAVPDLCELAARKDPLLAGTGRSTPIDDRGMPSACRQMAVRGGRSLPSR